MPSKRTNPHASPADERAILREATSNAIDQQPTYITRHRLEAALKEENKDHCKTRLPGLLDSDTKVRYRHLYGSPVEQLINHALKTDADLIVVGNHQWGMVHEAFKGSTAKQLLRHTPCCLLVTRDPVIEGQTKSPQRHTLATLAV